MGRKFYTFLRSANVCQRQCLSRWSLVRTQWLSTMTAACNNKSRFSGLVAHMCCFVKIHQFGFAGGRRRGGREPGSGCYLSTVTGEQRYQFRLLSVHGPPPPPLLSTDSARFTPTVFAVHPCTEDLTPPTPPRSTFPSRAAAAGLSVVVSPDDHVKRAPNFYPLYFCVKAFRRDRECELL